MQRIILDKNKKKLSFDELDYLVSPVEFAVDYSNLNIPLYNKNLKYWISLNDLSSKFISNYYYNKNEINDSFLKKPINYINEGDHFNYDIVIIDNKKNSFKISFSEFEKLRDYKTIDNTLLIEKGIIYLNLNNVKEELVIPYNSNSNFPLKINLSNNYNEISEVIINEKPLQKQFYFIIDKNIIEINKKIKEILIDNPSELRIIISGVKFLNN